MSTAPYLLYAGSYAGADQPGIYAFTFDAASGALEARGAWGGVANPSFLVVHPDGRRLYAVGETSQAQDGAPGAVWALGRPTEADPLTPLIQQPSGGDWPCHLAFDASGRWLVVSNYGSGTVEVLPLLADGTLGAPTDRQAHAGHGPNPERQTGPHAHSTTFTPDGRFAIVADLGLDALVVYEFDPATGRLHAHATCQTRPGAGPRHLAFHPAGTPLYVANELANTVAVYAYDAAQGGLSEQQVVPTVPPGAPENTVADIHIDPAGERLYVSNRGHDSIAVFAVGAGGQLAPVAMPPCGGRWPRNFAIAPGGRFLLVANQNSGTLDVLPVRDGTDALGPPVASAPVPGVSCVQFVAAP